MAAETRAEAESAIEQLAASLAGDQGLADRIFAADMTANMGGQLFIVDVELPDQAPTAAALSRVRALTGVRELADTPDTEPFLALPFTQAIEQFSSREILPPSDFAALTDAERSRAFTMTLAVSDAVREAAFSQLARAMEPEGPGLQEFIRSVAEDEIALGFTTGHHGYLEMVYRTATATSYGAGRYTQQTTPAMQAAGMLWEYHTAGDNRVRADHEVLDGKQWPVGDPEGAAAYPPNGYNCRCVMATRYPDQASQQQLDRAVDVTESVHEGFRAPPTSEILEAA